MTTGQDYELTFFNASDHNLVKRFNRTQHRMDNAEWMKIYNTKFVSDYGQLSLAIDAVSFEIRLDPRNLSWHLGVPRAGTDYTWVELHLSRVNNGSFPIDCTVELRDPY